MGTGELGGESGTHTRVKRKGGLGRILLGLGALVVLLVVGVAVVAGVWGPGIAAGFVKRGIPGVAQGSIAGPVSVDDVSLSWSGPQTIKGLRLRDPKGALVAEVDVRATTSISGLIFGSRDIGTVTLGGTVNIEKDGAETTLQTATKPVSKPGGGPGGAGSPGGGPSRLPSTLAGRLVIDGLTINYTDKTAGAGAVRSASLPDMKGEASFAVGQPLLVTLKGAGQVDGRPMAVNVDVKADGLTAPDGLLTPERLKVDATIDANLPSALLAGLPAPAGAAPVLEAVFAPDAGAGASDTTLAIKATGDAAALDATITAKAPGATLDGAIRATNIASTPAGAPARIATTRPLIAEITLTPRLAERLQQGPDGKGVPTGALAAPVRATAKVELDGPLPAGPSPDLRGLRAVVTLETTEMRGTVTMPGETTPAPFTVAPLMAIVDVPDLAGPVTIKAGTEATLRGQKAGTLAVDIRAGGLLDVKGAPKPGMPAELGGTIELTGFATAIAQPFVTASGLDMRRDVGDTLDLKVVAAAKPGVAGSSASPGTDLTAQVRSRNLTVDAALTADEKGVRATGPGVAVRIADAAPTLAAFLEKSGVRAQGPTPVSLTVTALDAPFTASKDGGKSVNPAGVRLAGRAQIGSLRVTTKSDPTPLALAGAGADLSLDPGSPAKALLDAKGDFGGDPFSLTGDLAIAELFAKDGKVNAGARPTGTIKVKDAPISLGALAGLGDQLELLRQAVGPTLNIDLIAAAGEGGSSDITADVRAANLTANAGARLRTDRIELNSATAKTTLTPGLLSAALDKYAPDMTDRPALLAPAVVNAEVGAMSVPLTGGKPDLAKSTPVKAKVSIEGEGARIRGVAIAGQPALEALLKGLTADATWSLAEGGPREVKAKADLIDLSGGATIAAFEAGARMMPGGALDASLSLDKLDTAKVDSVIGRPGLLAGALGSPASVTATVKPQGAKGAAQSMAIDASVRSPKLTTSAALVADDSKIALTKPMELTWTLEPAWASANLLGGDVSKAGFALATPVALAGTVERLAISRAPGAPLKPGVFDLGASLRSPSAELVMAEGGSATLGGVAVALKSTGGSGAPGLAFDLTIAEVTAKERGQTAGAPGRTSIKGSLAGIADAAGKPTPETATVTLDGDGQLPTVLVDAIAKQRGGLVELLGPMVTVKLSAKDLNKRGGRLSADATAARADAKLAGRIEGGVFYSSEAPITARVHEFTQEFAARTFEAAMPLLSNLEKKREDGPAIATVTGLELPIEPEIDTNADGKPDAPNLRKLNGDIRVELGATRYAASNLLGQVLKATKNKTEGKLFKNFPPLDVQIRQGVASYQKTRFPIGEFEVETRGKVDLAEKQMDLIVYLPLIAVADEVVGVFKLAPGLSDVTMLPFRIKGPVGSAVPVPAPDLLAKDLLKEFEKSPDKVIEGAGNLINDLLKKKKN